MKIAFTTKGKDWDSAMDPRFGRTEFFLIYDEEKDELTQYDNRDVANDAQGAGPQTAQRIYELMPDVLITGNGPGGNAATILEITKIKIVTGAAEITAREAYDAYKRGKLY